MHLDSGQYRAFRFHDLRAGLFTLVRALVLVASLAACLQAQGSYRFKVYGSDQGLTNLATNCLAQDGDGYLWVGTEGGIFRYDGQRFQGFGMAAGLTDLIVSEILPLRGGLLVLTPSGPFRFDGSRFHAFTASDGVPAKEVLCFASGAVGQVWMGTRKGPLQSEDGGLTFHPMQGAPAGIISALWADRRSGALFAARRLGEVGHRESSLARFLGGTWETLELPGELRKGVVDSIRVDDGGRIWLRGPSRLLRLAAWAAAPEDLTEVLPGKPAQGDALSLDHEGRVWAATDSGLACIENHRTWILGENQGLPSPWANATLTDREGSLWVAAEGVYRLQGRFLWTAYTRKQGLPVDAVWGIQRSRDGELWALTPRGMVHWEKEAWALVPETRERSFYCIAEDSEGGVWAGGLPQTDHPNTLFYRPEGEARFREIPVPSVERNTIGTLAAGKDGSLWIGAQSGGLHRLRKLGKAFQCEAVPLPGAIDQETINRVVVDLQGLVWCAGTKGLSVLDGGIWHRLDGAQGLKESNPSCVARDPKGNVWVAYWTQHGLTRLSREGGDWRVAEQVAEPVELFRDDIVSMDCDAKGVFWFGTTQGVKRWNPAVRNRAVVERFGRSQGLPGDDCTANALFLESNGDVWVGLSSGIAQFHAGFYHGPPPAPQAQLTLVKDGSSQIFPAGAGLQIPYRWRSMDFAFTSLSFIDEAHLTPQFRLVGFEDAWRATTAREARYTTLPPGDYRFEVRFEDANGQFGEPAVQPFTVLTPWWQKPWIYLLEALALAALVLLGIRSRTALLLRRTEALEIQVRQRTSDLQKANEALHGANAALEEASMMDALTSLWNRRYVGLHMPEEETRVLRVYRTFLAAGNPGLPKAEDLVFLLVDLDHFKFVNDTYGHAAGDLVLKEAAEVLRRACRETDTVVRWGGEEFLVVARRTDRAAAEQIARKIREALACYHFQLGGGASIQRTCSIGFAAFPLLPGHPAAFHWEDAVEMADQCLYAVKRSGRDGWVGLTCESVEADMAWAPRLLSDLPGLAAEGKLVLRSSFGGPGALVW